MSIEITPVVTQSGVKPDVYKDNLRAAWTLPYLNAGHNEITDLLPAQRDCLGGQDEFEAIQHVARIAVAALTTPATPLEQRLYELAESADEYDKLFIAIQELEDRLSQLQSELNSAGTAYPALQTFAKQVLGVVPIAEKPITNIIQSATDKRYTSLLDEKASVTLQLQELYTLRDTASKPWPVPQAMYRFPVLNQILVIDELPFDTQQKDCEPINVGWNRIRRAEILQHAAEQLAEILLSSPNTRFLPEDLGRILYEGTDLTQLNSVEQESYYRENTQHLLKPSVDVVRRILEQKGYTLLRGYRAYTDPETGKSLRRPRLIYSAVPTPEVPVDHVLYETYAGLEELPIVIPRKPARHSLRPVIGDLETEQTNDTFLLIAKAAQEAIQSLATHSILPDLNRSMAKQQVRHLKIQLFRAYGKRNKINSDYIRILYDDIINSKDGRLDALDILIKCLNPILSKIKSKHEYNKAVDILDAALIAYYESMGESVED